MDARVELAVPQLLRKARIREGLPFPLGATWTGLGVNFALFSANATKVELCIFDDQGDREIERVELPEFTDEVWHGFYPMRGPGRSTDTEFTARTIQSKATASMLTSFFSIPTPKRWSATWNGILPCSVIAWNPAMTSPSTIATARRLCRAAG